MTLLQELRFRVPQLYYTPGISKLSSKLKISYKTLVGCSHTCHSLVNLLVVNGHAQRSIAHYQYVQMSIAQL